MADYTNSKKTGALYPANAGQTVLGRLEPLIDPEQLKSRFLKGISMVLKIKNPETGTAFTITNEELKDYIDLALDEAENLTGLNLMPTKYTHDKLPFQKQDYEAFGYFQLPNRPISSIDSLTVRLSDGSDVFVFPLEWIETANLIWGQLNILPLAFEGLQGGTGIVGGSTASNPGGGTAVFFNSLWNRPWVSALFGVEYTTGFPDGMMPKYINSLIGNIAATRVLSQIAAAYALTTSVSLGIDGMSQSVSTPGPQRYQIRINELAEERKTMIKKIKKIFGTSWVIDSV